MTILAVSITKRDVWEGEPEEFSNVYHYSTEDGAPDIDFPEGISDSDAETLIEQIADYERQLHAETTEFVRGRVWGDIEAPVADRETLATVDLAGNGDHSVDPAACLEDTILIRMRTGRRSVRDRPVWLRKWYRTMGSPNIATSQWSDGVHARSEVLPDSDKDTVRAAVQDLVRIQLVQLTSFPDGLVLVSPSDRRLTSYSNPTMEVYDYLQTHDVKY